MRRTYDQVEAVLGEITDWLRGHQDLVDVIEAIGYTQSDAHMASGVQSVGLTYNDHLWCTLDAALADEANGPGTDVAAVVDKARRAAGRKPIQQEQITRTVKYVTEAIDAKVQAPSAVKAVALRILAAFICPTPEKHPAVLDAALAITKETHP